MSISVSLTPLASSPPAAAEPNRNLPLHGIFTPEIEDEAAEKALIDLGLKKATSQAQQITEAKHTGQRRQTHRLQQDWLESEIRKTDKEDKQKALELALLLVNAKIEAAELAGEAEALRTKYDFRVSIELACAPEEADVLSQKHKATIKINKDTKIPDREIAFGSEKGMQAAQELIDQIQATKHEDAKSESTLLPFAIDEADANGKTALILAAEYGLWNCVTLLLDNGADPSVTDNTLQTAGDYLKQMYIKRKDWLDEEAEGCLGDKDDETFVLEAPPTWSSTAQKAVERTKNKVSLLSKEQCLKVLRDLGVNLDESDKLSEGSLCWSRASTPTAKQASQAVSSLTAPIEAKQPALSRVEPGSVRASTSLSLILNPELLERLKLLQPRLAGRSRSVSQARPTPLSNRRGTYDAGTAALMAAKFKSSSLDGSKTPTYKQKGVLPPGLPRSSSPIHSRSTDEDGKSSSTPADANELRAGLTSAPANAVRQTPG